jgi:hypothetical protein
MSKLHGPARRNVQLAVLLAVSALSWTGCAPTERTRCTNCETQADASTRETGAPETGTHEDAATVGPSDPTSDAWPSAPSEGSSGGSSRCATTEMPLTEAVERDFGLAALRQQLEQTQVFQAQRRTWSQDDETFGEQPIKVELAIELGEFSFHASNATERDYCNNVRAPLTMHVRAQDALFEFTAQGGLLLEEASPETHVYASADSASLTGDLFPPGLVEVTLSAFPRQVRGEIHSWGIAVSLTPDACWQHELPLAPEEHVDFLDGRSVAELVAEAEDALQHTAMYDAVWQDSTETTLTLELGGGAAGTACARYDLPLSDAEGYRNRPHIELRVPYAGHLSTGDGRLAMPLDQLLLVVGSEDGGLWRVHGRGEALAPDFGSDEGSVRGEGDRLDAWIDFDLTSEPASADGFIEIQDADGPSSWRPVDCVAWPTGGSWDQNHCRYQR